MRQIIKALPLILNFMIDYASGSHLLHWSSCVQKHWDHDSSKCTSSYEDLECMDKLSVIGPQNCNDGFKVFIDVCCRKDDTACSFSCVPPSSEGLVTNKPLQESEVTTLVNGMIKLAQSDSSAGLVWFTLIFVMVGFAIQCCAVTAFLKKQNYTYQSRPLIEKNGDAPQDILEEQIGGLLAQPQSSPLNHRSGDHILSFASKDVMRESHNNSDMRGLQKIVDEESMMQQKVVFNTPSPLDIMPSGSQITQIVQKNSELLVGQPQSTQILSKTAQQPQVMNINKDEWYLNKMSLREMHRDIVQRSRHSRSKSDSKSFNAFEKQQSTEENEIDLETDRCKDFPKMNQSINNSFVEDQITEKKMGTLKQASVITQKTPQNNPLSLDVSRVNKIKQKQQELLDAAKKRVSKTAPKGAFKVNQMSPTLMTETNVHEQLTNENVLSKSHRQSDVSQTSRSYKSSQKNNFKKSDLSPYSSGKRWRKSSQGAKPMSDTSSNNPKSSNVYIDELKQKHLSGESIVMREVGPSIVEEADPKLSNMMIARPKMSSRGKQNHTPREQPKNLNRSNTIESQVSKTKQGIPKSVSNKHFQQIYSQKLTGQQKKPPTNVAPRISSKSKSPRAIRKNSTVEANNSTTSGIGVFSSRRQSKYNNDSSQILDHTTPFADSRIVLSNQNLIPKSAQHDRVPLTQKQQLMPEVTFSERLEMNKIVSESNFSKDPQSQKSKTEKEE